jgi:cell division protein FtsW
MNTKSKGQIDYILLIVVCFLILFGIVMIASIGVPKSIELTNTAGVSLPECGVNGVDCYYLFKKHLFRVLLAAILFFITVRLPLKFWRSISGVIYVGSLVTLALLLAFGSSNSTFATAWFTVFGNSIQPAEFGKIAIILYLARWLENKGKDVQSFEKGFVSFCVIAGLPILLLAGQPDFGSILIYSCITVGMFFLAGARVKHLAVGMVIAIFVGTIAITTTDYLKYRFGSYFTGSEEFCQVNDAGAARDYCWQTEQANIAVASGGFWGRGLTKGVQKSYWLPQASDDFIFAASAEELGFTRIIFVVFGFGFIGWRGLQIAKNAPDRYSMFLATGITLWITMQAFVNIGVNTGVLPVTGITLPFISYGGSSLMANMIGIGILLNISRNCNLNYAPTTNRRRNSRAHNAKPSYHRIYQEDPTDD